MNEQMSEGGWRAAMHQHARHLAHRHLLEDRRLLWSLCTITACAVAIVILPANADNHQMPTVQKALPLPAQDATGAPEPPEQPQWQRVTVGSGQTLSGIFTSVGLGFSEVEKTLDVVPDSSALRHLHPGQVLSFLRDEAGAITALRFDSGTSRRITLHFDGDDIRRDVHERSFGLRQQVAQGEIRSSLSDAVEKAGLNQAVGAKLAHVFRQEIDFNRDVRAGDRFTVVYNAVYRDGVYLHAGNVLAAEFYNNGKRYTAFRFKLPDDKVGYYTQDGRPLSVSLLRTPVSYTRISSSFGRRVDPVLHKRHLHAGVDLASPKGTPIHAASHGVITTHAWVRGYGRYVCVKLNSTYTTCYAHMSAYAKNLGVGSHVKQGQVIGYVGMTGYATGPHLHYEVRVHGKPVNPMTVTMPKPDPLPDKLLAQFNASIGPQLARLQILDSRKVLLASVRDSDGQPGTPN